MKTTLRNAALATVFTLGLASAAQAGIPEKVRDHFETAAIPTQVWDHMLTASTSPEDNNYYTGLIQRA
ncbi:hypothetical protein [Leptolyngbya sp. FACHB-261]|uniref:hypothetical protein n=1 Tax=Leptolyngbya sp. FACHB-261 TaxID=2692806 RepID=UPI0016862685|nr:hypothetical protein [Leptolyngbya sp. FACHB-261]MBD2104114.1 hypothetical protein [Leptolyngbya sp. FACHB-261]